MKRRNRMIDEADIIICSDADWRHLSEKQPGAKFVLLQSHVTATLAACGPAQNDAECAHQLVLLVCGPAVIVVHIADGLYSAQLSFVQSMSPGRVTATTGMHDSSPAALAWKQATKSWLGSNGIESL